MFKIGDVIIAYHKGFWRVIRVIRRYYDAHDVQFRGKTLGVEYSPLLQYEKVMDASFRIPVGKKSLKECDALYCKVVDID